MNATYTDEKVNTILRESYARVKVMRDEYHFNQQIIKDKVKGLIRKAQARNKELKKQMWNEEYVVQENALRRGIW